MRTLFFFYRDKAIRKFNTAISYGDNYKTGVIVMKKKLPNAAKAGHLKSRNDFAKDAGQNTLNTCRRVLYEPVTTLIWRQENQRTALEDGIRGRVCTKASEGVAHLNFILLPG